MNSKRISVLLIGILLLYAPASVVGDTNGSDNSYTNYSTIDAEYVPLYIQDIRTNEILPYLIIRIIKNPFLKIPCFKNRVKSKIE